MFLLALGASYEAFMAAGDADRYPARGQLVDVGGYRMHVSGVGEGSPTVVLDAGLGGFSLDWSLVQLNSRPRRGSARTTARAMADPLCLPAQQEMARLSSNAKLIVVDGSSHYIYWDHPALVVDAIRQVAQAARR